MRPYRTKIIASAFALSIAALAVTATAASIWQLQATPASGDLNGISAPSLDFAMAVGNGGTIVRFDNGSTGTLMNSGTTNDLFDVYATAPSMAAAAGRDTVLLWDGNDWNPIRSSSDGSIYTGTWITPEQDLVLYDVISGGIFDYVCPYVPGATTQGFCRTFGPAMVAACGHSGDIKIINENGDIFHVDNTLADLDSTYPIFSQSLPLNLNAVWAPQLDCLPGAFPPQTLFAIANFNEFWRFDGQTWINMNISIPSGQVLTAITGIGPDFVIASGYEPAAGGGNEGVVWIYDGQTWSQDTELPANTPGLIDVVANAAADPDYIFASGFEAPGSVSSSVSNLVVTTYSPTPGVNSRVQTVGEQGQQLVTALLHLGATCDVAAEVSLLTTPPISANQDVLFHLVAKNVSGESCPSFRFSDLYFTGLQTPVSDTCQFTNSNNSIGDTLYFRSRDVPALAPGDMFSCTTKFNVLPNASGTTVTYTATLTQLGDLDSSDNIGSATFAVQ